eukprot:15189-Heterococcus_DN1.PRE.1
MASVKAVLESGKDNPYEQYKIAVAVLHISAHMLMLVFGAYLFALAVLQCMYDKKKRAVSEEASRAFCSYTVSYCAALCLALTAHCGTELLMHT